MNLGRLIFDEIACKIVNIWLEGGAIWIEARSSEPGDYRIDPESDFSVYAPDGTLVLHAPSAATGKNRTTTKNGTFTVRLPLKQEFAGRAGS